MASYRPCIPLAKHPFAPPFQARHQRFDWKSKRGGLVNLSTPSSRSGTAIPIAELPILHAPASFHPQLTGLLGVGVVVAEGKYITPVYHSRIPLPVVYVCQSAAKKNTNPAWRAIITSSQIAKRQNLSHPNPRRAVFNSTTHFCPFLTYLPTYLPPLLPSWWIAVLRPSLFYPHSSGAPLRQYLSHGTVTGDNGQLQC